MTSSMNENLKKHLIHDHHVPSTDSRMEIPWITHESLHAPNRLDDS
jgi:hypothetical protein